MSDDPPDPPSDRTDDAAWGFASPGETRFASAVSIVAVMVLQVLLPTRLTIGPWWLLPAIEGAVLVTLIIVEPSKLDAEARDARVIALGLVAILIAANGTTLGLLIHHLLRTGDDINGRTLIYSAVAVWSNAVLAFGILYWEIDRGGPQKRCMVDHGAPDFLFPQMQNPTTTATRWTPRFIDYLYLSLTNSTAFSPTDALPLTVRAKALMAVQSVASLGTIVLVGARAVNILR
jgi:hypothetical protein